MDGRSTGWRGAAMLLVSLGLTGALVGTDGIAPADASRPLAVSGSGEQSVAADIVLGDGRGENFSVATSEWDRDTFWTPHNSILSVSDRGTIGESLVLTVYTKRNRHITFQALVYAPDGQRLNVGDYRNTKGSFGVPGPALQVSTTTGGCGTETGHFEILDLARNGAQTVRLWLVYERWCDGLQVGTGEVRFGYPKPKVDAWPHVAWRAYPLDVGEPIRERPFAVRVRKVAADSATVGSPQIVGADAADFRITNNRCEGSLTEAGCRIWVRFDPTGPGPRHARLKIPTSRGVNYTDLDGIAEQGTSAWTLDMDNRVDDTYDRHYDIPLTWNGLNDHDVWSEAWPDGTEDSWRLRFHHSSGAPITAGETYVSGQDDVNVGLAHGTGAIYTGDGWLRVDDFATRGPDHLTTRYDIRFHYTYDALGLTVLDGHVQYQQRDDITGPARVSDTTAVRDGDFVEVTWTNPTSPDFSRIIIRWHNGLRAPGTPTTGRAAYYGQGTATRFRAPRHKPVNIAIWAFDQEANHSTRRVITLPAA